MKKHKNYYDNFIHQNIYKVYHVANLRGIWIRGTAIITILATAAKIRWSGLIVPGSLVWFSIQVPGSFHCQTTNRLQIRFSIENIMTINKSMQLLGVWYSIFDIKSKKDVFCKWSTFRSVGRYMWRNKTETSQVGDPLKTQYAKIFKICSGIFLLKTHKNVQTAKGCLLCSNNASNVRI